MKEKYKTTYNTWRGFPGGFDSITQVFRALRKNDKDEFKESKCGSCEILRGRLT